MDGYPEANLRHYAFMLEGLKEIQSAFTHRGIKMVVRYGLPSSVALSFSQQAAVIVCDRGYLRHQKIWRNEVAEKAECRVVQVESDVVVPVDVVSGKAEYAARTIRPKIHKHLDEYLVEADPASVENDSLRLKIKGLSLADTNKILNKLKIDQSVPPVSGLFHGGTSHAKTAFQDFLKNNLVRYAENSNQPQTDDISHMSMYLHFGQISPLSLALQINRVKATSDKMSESKKRFLEELIVRRELAINFVHFTQSYDAYDCIPAWAKTTLHDHAADKREFIYSRNQLEAAQTHDPYWNAAMKEMKVTGFMHNYMRMYWGKKILEWSSSPQKGFMNTLSLNNKYFLDGRDPNSFTGVAWIYGVHDRAWFERSIFGKIRYMAASGLERKCDIQGYVEKVEALSRESR
jgi:deoxyribodipyrimidine photo-lyase